MAWKQVWSYFMVLIPLFFQHPEKIPSYFRNRMAFILEERKVSTSVVSPSAQPLFVSSRNASPLRDHSQRLPLLQHDGINSIVQLSAKTAFKEQDFISGLYTYDKKQYTTCYLRCPKTACCLYKKKPREKTLINLFSKFTEVFKRPHCTIAVSCWLQSHRGRSFVSSLKCQSSPRPNPPGPIGGGRGLERGNG